MRFVRACVPLNADPFVSRMHPTTTMASASTNSHVWHPFNNFTCKLLPLSSSKDNGKYKTKKNIHKALRETSQQNTIENMGYLEDFVKCIIEPDDK